PRQQRLCAARRGADAGRSAARVNRFAIAGARVGGPELLIVAGPCVVESGGLCLTVASKLKELTAARGLPFVFKASFRKANRSSADSFTGLADHEGLDALSRGKLEVGVPVLTDIHEESEVKAVAQVADAL